MSGNADELAILVPFGAWNDGVLECVAAVSRLKGLHDGWVLWLIPDEDPNALWSERLAPYRELIHMEIVATGPGNPSQKRNAALRRTSAPIIALIDSDAFPEPDWLVNALQHLKDDVGVVAGPNLTPPGDLLLRRVCGRVMESPIGFGEAYIRHTPVSPREVREMPTCNMVYRRVDDLFFHEELATGEDMVFCSEMRAAGWRVWYDPDVRVYHHRRKLGWPFMQQFFGYGLNKGRLMRMGSDITYGWQAVPTLFLLYLLGACAAAFLIEGRLLLALWTPAMVYAIVILRESIRAAQSVRELLLCIPAFPLGHLSYGAGYLAGLLKNSMGEDGLQ